MSLIAISRVLDRDSGIKAKSVSMIDGGKQFCWSHFLGEAYDKLVKNRDVDMLGPGTQGIRFR